MSITWTDVTNLDPSLSTVPLVAQTAILEDVYQMLDASRWGDKLDLAAKYLAMHTAALILRGGATGATGAVVSETLGDASHTFANTSVLSAMGDLDITLWGQRFRLLLRGLGYIAFVA